jgi:hypothetical protein
MVSSAASVTKAVLPSGYADAAWRADRASVQITSRAHQQCVFIAFWTGRSLSVVATIRQLEARNVSRSFRISCHC